MSEKNKEQPLETAAPETAKPEEEETTPLAFQFKPVKKKPNRKYRKGSKYDPVLDAFIKGTDKLVKVEVKDKDANYIRTQLKKRVDARELVNVVVAVVNDVCYLEKK